jgi:hypothetical protein
MVENRNYIKMPIDMGKVKEVFFAGLTKRQLVCFGIGAACGFPIYFLVSGLFGVFGGIVAMSAVAFPAIFCGIYDNGTPFEKRVLQRLRYFQSAKKRVYISRNAADYAMLLSEQSELLRKLTKERKNEKNAFPRGKKSD